MRPHDNGDGTTTICIMTEGLVEETLNNLPHKQPERKTGSWIQQDFNKSDGMISTTVYYLPKCSVCGYVASPTKFCPNCGADMRGEHIGQ